MFQGHGEMTDSSQPQRKIVHVDMDAFYASVEQRDFPELRGRPVAVGGRGRRGVVMTASYEARKYGVHSAMPSVVASRLCSDLIFRPPRFDAYKEAAGQIREVFRAFAPLVEPLSLDEAFLDVTRPKQGPPSATLIARAIKQEIQRVTGLTSSAGVSFNKFLAKVASGINKPDGLTVILPTEAPAFLDALPVEKFFGVGPATAEKMRSLGIRTGADLRTWTEDDLRSAFGKAGGFFYRIVRGEDDRPVRPFRRRKSLGAERTFAEDLDDVQDMVERIRKIAHVVFERLQRTEHRGRTVTLKIKYADFKVATRSKTVRKPPDREEELLDLAVKLLHTPDPPARPVRLLGVTVSGFDTAPVEAAQLELDLYT
jgi:DNA polymerase-4